jgi:hypothetical protein
MGLVENGLTLLQRSAFPVYQKNVDRREPPIAHGESTPSGIAVLLIATGLDYHLSRLKYFRDYAPHDPPLPYTPYFKWTIGDALYTKIDCLLTSRNDKRLREQLVEITIVRDSVAHLKIYTFKEKIRQDYSFGRSSAILPQGEAHRQKALTRKRVRSERTRLLALPLVPTWISYGDAVTCVMVLNRFLNLLERKYGNPYAWVGGFFVRNDPGGFFKDWGNKTRPKYSV